MKCRDALVDHFEILSASRAYLQASLMPFSNQPVDFITFFEGQLVSRAIFWFLT